MLRELLPPITDAELQRHAFLAQKGHLNGKEMKEYNSFSQQRMESSLSAQERAAYSTLIHAERLDASQKAELIAICRKLGYKAPKSLHPETGKNPKLPIAARKAARKYYLIYMFIYIALYILNIFLDVNKNEFAYLTNFLMHLLFIALVTKWNIIMSVQSVDNPKYLLIKQLISFTAIYWIIKIVLSFIIGTVFVISHSIALGLIFSLLADIIMMSIPPILAAWIPWRI